MTVLIPTNGYKWWLNRRISLIQSSISALLWMCSSYLNISLSIPIHPYPSLCLFHPQTAGLGLECDCKRTSGKKDSLAFLQTCQVRIVCTDTASETRKLGICGFCTHFRCFLPGFTLDFTALLSFSFSFSCFFSCFFFHATATWKERSSSASEWSLGFTLKCRLAPATRH